MINKHSGDISTNKKNIAAITSEMGYSDTSLNNRNYILNSLAKCFCIDCSPINEIDINNIHLKEARNFTVTTLFR